MKNLSKPYSFNDVLLMLCAAHKILYAAVELLYAAAEMFYETLKTFMI